MAQFEPGNKAAAGRGRPSKAEKFKRPIAVAEKRCADRLPEHLDNLEQLADGGYQRVTEKWEPAGLILIDLPLRDSTGDPVTDADGKVIMAKQPAFPGLAPDALVLIQRTTEIADRDRAANIYLVDRIMGKPTVHEEHEHSGAVTVTPMTLEQWKALAAARRAAAEATLATFDEAEAYDA